MSLQCIFNLKSRYNFHPLYIIENMVALYGHSPCFSSYHYDTNIQFYKVHVCVCLCHHIYRQVIEQTVDNSSVLISCGNQILNSCCQARRQQSLPARDILLVIKYKISYFITNRNVSIAEMCVVSYMLLWNYNRNFRRIPQSYLDTCHPVNR